MVILSSLKTYSKTPTTLPLWEVGVGTLNFRSDHYRGSAEHNYYFWPIPAFIYRGANVEADNGFFRKHFIKNDKYTLDLSISLGLNVDSDHDSLRKGMDDLGPIFEVGPMFRYYLWKSKDGTHFLNFEMPYRAVYATDLKTVQHVGYYSIPYLTLISKASPDTFHFSTEFSAGVSYGSGNYHDYFYGVSENDVTAQRPHYTGVRGYSGFQLAAVVSRRFDNFLVTPFIRYDNLEGVAFQNSPLFKNRHYTQFGVALIWYFQQSSEKQGAPTLVR
jgi:outer membrane protein